MKGDSTGVHVHESMFPLRVLAQLVPADPKVKDASDRRSKSFVKRLDPLFRYEPKVDIHASKDKGKQRESTSSSNDGDSLNNREILTYESPVEGTVCEWCVQAGDILENPYKPILRIIEPCKHPVQLGGLCAVCGKDLTAVDYTGFSETSRANIQMTHDSSALTVSLEEADRIERQTSQRLVKEKKLSLIVDLDQTVIQATVDPTVGDWMHDEKNPNYPALRDVQRFRLLNDAGQEDGCWYYVKPRPTLSTFLKECAKMYEMHVYTMGTRQYAENVCKVIDPDGKIFSTRILSRDESGSMVHKSLERLFPVDQSMVVVIDDRADVWDWSPNLVKVVPYDFFIGTGDINGAFLPKAKAVLPPGVATGTTANPTPPEASTSGTDQASSSTATASRSTTPGEEVPLAVAISEQNEALDHQVHDKPLAKMQEEKTAHLHHLHAEKEKQKSGSTTPVSSDGDTAMPLAKAAAPDSSSPSAEIPSPPVPSSSTTQSSTAPAAPAQAPAKPPAPVPASNGIGASRFVSKSTLNDTASDSDSSSDDSSNEDDAPNPPAAKQEEKATETAEKPLPAAVDQVKEEEKTDVDIEKPEEGEAPMQIDGEWTEDAQEADLDQEEEAVLKNNDIELDRVLKILSDVHDRYFSNQDYYDGGVPDIIPDMKRQVLSGCHIVFSGVIPLDQDPKRSELWRVSEQFGATLSGNFTSRTTHLVAAKAGTSKVNSARRKKPIQIVTPGWLLDSVAKWTRQPEDQYLLDVGTSSEATESISNTNSPSSFHGTPDPDPPDETTMVDELESNDELEEDDDEALHDMDWGDAEAEIQAALDETDDDDEGMASQSDAESTTSGPTRSRKRGRHSLPPVDASASSGAPPVTGSPLSKRRKVAAERAGKSKLKMSESLLNDDDTSSSAPAQLTTKSTATMSSSSNSQKSSPRIPIKDNDGTTTDDDDLDDFAKALEGELS